MTRRSAPVPLVAAWRAWAGWKPAGRPDRL